MPTRIIEVACTRHPDEQAVWPEGVIYCPACGHGDNLDERTTDIDATGLPSVEWGTRHYEGE